jgi:hypothetical protein
VSPSCSARAPCRCVLRVSQIRQRTVCPYKTLTTFLLQVMYSRDAIKQDPILAAVGGLQFEVVQHRMKQEYGVETTLDPLAFSVAPGGLGGGGGGGGGGGTPWTRRGGYSTRSA